MNIDMKVKQLAKSPKAMAVIDKYIPGFSTDRQLKLAYGMKLSALFDFPQMAEYREIRDDLARDLEAIEE
jgi:hypothetical protein